MDTTISRNTIRNTIIAVIIIVLSLYLYNTRVYRSYQEITSISNTEGNVAEYISLDTGFLKYTQDGVSYLKNIKSQAVEWTETYSMNNPKAVGRGKYIAIADYSGNDVCIFNQHGKVGSITMPYPIVDVEVASQGVIAVILQGEKENYIKMYTKEGTLISDIRSKTRKNGYPMDISISSDAQKMVVSYFSIEGAGIKNKISFYDFSEENKTKNSNLIGEDNQKSNLVGKVEFLDDDTVFAVGDEKTIIYSFKQEVKQKKIIKVIGDIQSIVIKGDYIGYLYKSAIGKEEYNKYILSLYNKQGMKLYSKADAGNYDSIELNGKEIIATKGSQMYIFNESGWRYYAGEFEEKIENIIPTGKQDEYTIVFQDKTQVIQIR
ncbi:MAG: DUF5711 family protein [Lachnospiraceae bacterium]